MNLAGNAEVGSRFKAGWIWMAVGIILSVLIGVAAMHYGAQSPDNKPGEYLTFVLDGCALLAFLGIIWNIMDGTELRWQALPMTVVKVEKVPIFYGRYGEPIGPFSRIFFEIHEQDLPTSCLPKDANWGFWTNSENHTLIFVFDDLAASLAWGDTPLPIGQRVQGQVAKTRWSEELRVTFPFNGDVESGLSQGTLVDHWTWTGKARV